MPLAPSKRLLDEGARPPLCAGSKRGEGDKALLWTLLHEDPECPSGVRLDKGTQRQAPRAGRVRHLQR
jgi:hypothetical protein